MEKVVRAMLHHVIESKAYNEQVIDAYFSPNYVQLVDDTQLNFDAFKQHIKKLKEIIANVDVEILSFATHDNRVFTKHVVHSVLKDGSKHTHKVFAEFSFENNKIIRCEELTHMLEGSEKDLGSIT